jgi:aspartyl-tRNA(Asn)/glutamyl-tRNA(Gln) amidotransferase subunit B
MVTKETPLKIGLEIHGYLDTKEKLFCKCSTHHNKDSKPNSVICPICTGQPGSKPMLPNKEAMKKISQISLILNCNVNHDKKLIWQRKHYSWPDLPKGYQNTISGAYSVPCAENGKFQGIKIRETHLEEDPARWNPQSGKIDYNRSGLPLIEIVTEPDFSNSEQVVSWLKNLILVLSYIKVIKKGAGIKVDVNVSTYGERAEIKNINSIENIRKAIEYEIVRQLENYHGEKIVQKRETLTYDEKEGKTIKMRDKEGAMDYRFIPDPDLPTINLDKKELIKMQKELPELPKEKLNKLIKKYEIDKKDAEILIQNLELVEFFEKLAEEKIDVKKNLSWITVELLRILHYNKKSLADEEIEIFPEHIAELIKSIEQKKLTPLKAKQIMNDFIPKSFSIKNKKDITNISEDIIKKACIKVIKENPLAVQDYHSGKKESLNFLIGQVMRISQRRADYKTAKNCLVKLIN